VREYLLVGLIGAALVVLAASPVRAWAESHGVMAEIRDRDVHDVPIPRLGGLAMAVGLLAALLVASRLPLLSSVFTGTEDMQAVASGALLIVALGAADDRWGLDAVTKLAGQTVAAAVMALQGIQLVWLPLPGRTLVLDPLTGSLVAVVIVLVVVNAVNFIDGLDGLAAGIIGIGASATFVFSYALSVQNGIDRALTPSLLSAALVGICAGFLVHNFNPARIFMGDTGSMLIGLLLAASTISLTGRVDYQLFDGLEAFPTLLPLLLPFAVLAVPFLDLVLAVLRRTRSGRSPFTADKQHLHHRLLELGHSQRRAVLLMYAWTALVAYGALAIAFLPSVAALVGIAVATVLLLVAVRGPRETVAA
jgi:UDP-GlcNAc:undecaprenyl-phosphate GlcNAc-1-phosphate transferase